MPETNCFPLQRCSAGSLNLSRVSRRVIGLGGTSDQGETLALLLSLMVRSHLRGSRPCPGGRSELLLTLLFREPRV